MQESAYDEVGAGGSLEGEVVTKLRMASFAEVGKLRILYIPMQAGGLNYSVDSSTLMLSKVRDCLHTRRLVN